MVIRGDSNITLDNYGKALSIIASRCEPTYHSMGMAGYEYQSIKDSIKDFDMNVKELRKPIAAIGRYVGMSDESFNKFMNTSMIDNLTKEDIEAAINKAKK